MSSERNTERGSGSSKSAYLKLMVICVGLFLTMGLMLFTVKRAGQIGYIYMIARGHTDLYVQAQDPQGFMRVLRGLEFLGWMSGVLSLVSGGYAVKLRRDSKKQE